MLSFYRHSAGALSSLLFLFCASGIAQADSVTVTPTVTDSAGVYTYAYSISYTGTNDAFLIDISVPDNPAAVTDIVTPAGFTSQFDSVNGLVSFLENTSSFTSTPTSGFSFESPDGPGHTAFVASIADDSGDITTFSGSTLAPTPEPGYVSLLAVMVLGLAFFKRRTKNSLTLETQHVSNS